MGAHVASRQTAAPQRADPQRSASHARSRVAGGAASPIHRLQRAVGNRAISSLLRSPTIQPKLSVSHPDDPYEREADRVADQVMRMADGQDPTTLRIGNVSMIQRKCACGGSDEPLMPVHSKSPVSLQAKLTKSNPTDIAEQEADRVAEQVTSMREPRLQGAGACGGGCASFQRKQLDQGDDGVQIKNAPSNSSVLAATPRSVNDVLNSPGERLDLATRAFMEPRFGHDFSGVRVHTDARAAEAARDVNALAFTIGRHIAFAQGRYAHGTDHGNRLLAHELTHIVQQDGATAGPSASIQRLGDLSQVPAVIGCDVATSTSARVVTSVLFGIGSAALSPTAVAAIDAFATAWNGLGTSPNVRIDGFASTDGSDPDNWLLSCARARAVEAKLTAPTPPLLGVPSASITEVLAQGETFEFGPSFPPNRRATISADMTPAATSAIFSESPTQMFAGYDASVIPNILTVPTAGTREAQVTRVPAGGVVNFASRIPFVASVAPTVDGIEVTGISDGTTAIDALTPAGALLDTLDIEVKDQRPLSVDFHFMSDTVAAPGVAHRTTRVPADAATLTGTLNRIWERQANVLFTAGTTDSPTVGTDLGPDVQGSVSTDPEWAAVIAFRTGANYNVFLVWEFNLLGTPPGTDTAEAGTAAGDTLLEDNACADGLTIAHEAGHFMGISLPHPANTIMSGCGGADRQRVTHAQADIVNP
ncbi:MAG: eCIS core domain-containing protein [Pyrinomonadaceae bacterium]